MVLVWSQESASGYAKEMVKIEHCRIKPNNKVQGKLNYLA